MRRIATLLLCLSVALSGHLLGQTHPNLERGFNAGKTYQVDDVDSVNLFNGNLSMAIPLGQTYSAGGGLSYSFVLRYNSNVWAHKLQTFTNDCTPPYNSITVTQTTPHTVSSGLNGGLGWALDFGELLYSGSGMFLDQWTYVAPDGSTHPFYNSLHSGETERSGFRYTRDGSYIRLVASLYSAGYACPGGFLAATLEFPDGRQRSFTRTDTCNPFVLVSETDRYGNSISYTYDAPNSRWVIQDSTGRTHYIGLTWIPGANSVIDYVDLAAFDDPAIGGPQRAHYSFVYQTADIARSCKHYYDPAWDTCDPQLPPTVTVPLLTTITQPDGSQWTMMSGANPAYNLDDVSACSSGTIPKDRPGTITHLQNPVGGTYDWTWSTWTNPEGGTSCYAQPGERGIVKEATGVYDRTLTDPFGASTTGVWQYRHDSWRLGDGSVDSSAQESWTTVQSPIGDESKHYFRTQYCGAPTEGWDYGLPYSKGRYGNLAEPWISSEQYDGSVSPSNLRRSSYLRYAKDVLNSVWSPSYLQQSNRRVDFERTSFNDDPITGSGAPHYTTVTRSDFDGLGHFRIAEVSGSFGATRTTTTAFNPGLTYPPASSPAEWWPYTSPWILGTYTYTRTDENKKIAKTEACFDASTGYLERTRVLRLSGKELTDPARSSSDVVTRRTQTAGNTTREEWFGGDTQSVGTGALCSVTLPAPVYRIDHAYSFGSLATSRYADSAGTPVSFYSVDRDIDASTGLATASRDSAGLATDFVYDALGRLTWEKPRTSPVNGGSWEQHCYFTAAPPATPGRLGNYWWPNGTTKSCGSFDVPLQRDAVDFDGFGRPWREYRRLFDTSWAQRLTTYNGMGWTRSVSEWQAYLPAVEKKTEYLGFDPFGRATTVRPPDGASHDVTLAYTGSRRASRTVSIVMAQGSESPSTTTEEYDHHGRLVRVIEPSGPSGSNVTTNYAYDVGSRLKSVSTTSGSTTQLRQFLYDNRGFPTSEQHPELGSYGNGSVSYLKYDARGHALRVTDGAHDRTYTFDAAERLTQVAQADSYGNPGSPVLRTWSFGTSNTAGDWRNGKLILATSFNPDLAGASVSESFVYGGLGGRLSSRSTAVEGRLINQAFTWNDLGQLATLGYPDDTALDATLDPPRTLTMAYSYGALTSISPFLTSISYHPNAMPYEVFHSNGLKDQFLKDPDDMPRIGNIYVQRASDGLYYGGWGPYSYDGAGNVKASGSDWYAYDPVSRLTTGTVQGGAARQCASYSAFGALVGLGTSASTCVPSPIALDEGTNRLSSPVSYDAAGNVTSWGGSSYSWDRLSQMSSTAGLGFQRQYAYSADGERLLERNVLDGTATLGLRDLSGNLLREYRRSAGGSWSWSRDYAYRGRIPVASITSAGTRHLHVDTLGSVRGATDSQNPPQILWDTLRDYYPFGMDSLGAADADRLRFTGHQRDTLDTSAQTDDLDYMHARHYSPILGRFLSVDPGRDFDPRAPQTWNLFAYAGNNPVTFTDPTGLMSENGRVIAQAEVVAEDPGAASARRAELELRLMRLRSTSQSSGSSFGGQLAGAFTNNQMPTIIRGVADSDWMDPFVKHVLYDVADQLPTDLPGFGLFAMTMGRGGPGLSTRPTYLYQKLSAEGAHLKFGVTIDPLRRYTAAQLAGGRLKILASGARQDMLALERSLHSTLPLGPEEKQLFYRIIQRLKGLQP